MTLQTDPQPDVSIADLPLHYLEDAYPSGANLDQLEITHRFPPDGEG